MATTVIKLEMEQREGLFYVSSADVPGLHLAGYDMRKVLADVVPAIKYLFKMNRGLDVEVRPASPVERFPDPGPIDRPAGVYVIDQVAAEARR